MKVSIIIPYFNQHKYIKECVESVLDQNIDDFEVIIVDDGSESESTKILKTFENDRISIYHKKNEGVCIARNYGFSKSKGEYILFLDADDKLAKNYLLNAVEILEKNKQVKLVTSRVMLFGKINREYLLPDFDLKLLLARNIFVITSLLRRSDFILCKGFKENMKDGFEDWDFWISLFSNGGDVVKLDEIGFYYRILENSRNRNISNLNLLRRKIYENHKDLYCLYLLDPIETFEYQNIINSKEYLFGQFILKPFRIFKNYILKLKR